MSRRFTIEQLRTLVARALQTGSYTPAESKRVRAVPDKRTIRYYTTLGLIDRPAEMRGRTAFYADKHVLQLVAIKRLQGRSLTLSDIQKRLLGATEKQLKELAALPAEFWAASDDFLESRSRQAAFDVSESTTDRVAESAFWAVPPALPGENTETSQPSFAADAEAGHSVSACLRFSLTNELELLVASKESSVAEKVDLALLQAAAAPLLNELSRQGILPKAQTNLHVAQPPAREDTSPHESEVLE